MPTNPETLCIHSSIYDPAIHEIVGIHFGLEECGQKCGGYSSSSSGSGIYRLVSLKAQQNTPAGQSIPVSLSNGEVNLVFSNVSYSGDTALQSFDTENENLIFYHIDSEAEFEGDFSLTVDSPAIDPSKSPILVHIYYDDTSEEVMYEEITTSTANGQISGTASSLGSFVVVKDTSGFNPCVLVSNCGGYGAMRQLVTDEDLSNKASCKFELQVETPEPCPGGQTRGNWAIDENGVPIPRLFASKCDCYVPSIATVEMVVGAATGLGAARGAACAGWRAVRSLGIPTIKNSIKNTKSLIDEGLTRISDLFKTTKARQDVIEAADGFIEQASAWLEKADYEISTKQFELDDIKQKLGIIQGDLELDVPLPPLVKKLEQEISEKVKTRNLIFSKKTEQIQLKQTQEQMVGEDAMQRLLEETNVSSLRALSAEKAAELAAAEGARTSILVQISKATGDALASGLAMYSFVNEISFKKTCPNGETLNPLTCECCTNCAGEKVFPDPMNGCDCVCPPNKVPCLSVSDTGCYDPCPPGQVRLPPDCECGCLDGECSSSSSSESVPDCITFQWTDNAPEGGSCGSPILGGSATVTIPDSYSIPPEGLLISIFLVGDDNIKFNGSRYGDTGCIMPKIDTTDRVFTNTFTIDFLDTQGGNVGGGGCICILNGRPNLEDALYPSPCQGGTLDSGLNGWSITFPCTTQRAYPNFVAVGNQCANLDNGLFCDGTPGC